MLLGNDKLRRVAAGILIAALLVGIALSLVTATGASSLERPANPRARAAGSAAAPSESPPPTPAGPVGDSLP